MNFWKRSNQMEGYVKQLKQFVTTGNATLAAELNRIQTVEEVPKPTPEAVEPILLAMEYAELAKKVGYSFGENIAKANELRNWLIREEIPIYNTDKVIAYLEMECRKITNELGTKDGDWFGAFWEPLGVYTRQIPVEILRLAARVAEGPGEKDFYVSEIVKRPDPFLLVAPRRVDMSRRSVYFAKRGYVIAVWDEPGFSTVKQKDPSEP